MLNKLIKFLQWLWGSCACTCQSSCTDNCQKDNCVCGCLKREAPETPHSPAVVKSLKETSTTN